MDTKPRILLGVTADMSLRLMRGFPEYLVRQGWDVHVVSSPGPALDALKLVEGITAHPIRMARQPSPFADLNSLIRWTRLLRQVRPDLISVGTPKAGLLGGLAGWMTRVPHRIYHLRGLRLETSRGPARHILNAIEKLAMKSAHHVLGVSNSLGNRAIELGLLRRSKISVLGAGSSNGVPTRNYDPASFSKDEVAVLFNELGLVAGVPVVGFVGRLTEDKGLSVLAAARTILHRNRIDHQLLVVGGKDGSTGDLNLENQSPDGRPTVVTGYVANPEIYYQLMDILCLPSFREGFPNVVLEAAAAGVPTVTTTATGAVDSVVHGETGLIANVGSAEDLSRQLGALLADERRRVSMGRRAQTHVRESFEAETVWSLYEGFYAEALLHVDHVSVEESK